MLGFGFGKHLLKWPIILFSLIKNLGGYLTVSSKAGVGFRYGRGALGWEDWTELMGKTRPPQTSLVAYASYHTTRI